MKRKALSELGVLTLLLLLPLLLFAPVALGPKTLLPVDNLFQHEPYRAAADELGVDYPHNHLVSDLILENYAWKSFLLDAIHSRQLPLWDPYIFAGHPFLANGQHAALYPPSVIFYLLPLWRAYGVFAWLQLGLAGIFAYLFARVLGVRRLGGLIAGIVFQLSGFMVVSSVPHPMIVASASWLPFILAMIELVVRQQAALGRRPATLPWALLGALGLGCQVLAGHGEGLYFSLLVAGAYALWRLLTLAGPRPSDGGGLSEWLRRCRRPALWLLLMLALGLALGAVQFAPFLEVNAGSFRGGEAAASLEQVLGWAYPKRRLITFAIPNFFGSPAHHGYRDLFTWRWALAPEHEDGRYIYWGIKNHVEGAAYLGLLPLLLAVIAVLQWLRRYVSRFTPHVLPSPFRSSGAQHAIPFFALLSLFSLGCIFGAPIYALVYVLPGLEQSHSPFRWVFPLTVAVAVLAGFGVEAVARSRDRSLGSQEAGGQGRESRGNLRSLVSNLFLLKTDFSPVSLLAALAFWGGLATLAGLILSRIFFAQIEPLVEQVFLSLARAPDTFPGHRAFYSYELKWAALFGLLLMGAGVVLRVSRCPIYVRRRPVWEYLAVGLLVLDLVAFGVGFAPAVDPALLDYVPPVVEFLRRDNSLWRYAALTTSETTKTMNPNVGMFYDLQAVNGYDSLFSDQYRDYMALIEPQGETLYNLITAFRKRSSLDSPLTDLLNVKYVITELEIESPKYELVYQDQAVRVYENLGVMPRAFTLPTSATIVGEDVAEALRTYDPRRYVIVEPETLNLKLAAPEPASNIEQLVSTYTINEVFIDATVSASSWLVLADSYFLGWKAFVRPLGADGASEQQVDIYRADGNFRAVRLEPGAWTVRFKYSPDSVKIGAFVSFIAGMTVLFLTGLYLWRFLYREEDDASTVRRVAKNTLAPVILTLFNRVIDFAFAALMARILGPRGLGRYATATNVYLWFDTIANFGLDMYLMRELSQDRARGRQLFVNTTLLRLLLFVGVAPILGGFLAGRQAVGTPLPAETVWMVVLLYAGLLPGTLANSLTALFRACEKHEVPAAIQTVTTIVKVTLGTLVLVGGLGIIGLAGAAILTNVVTVMVLGALAWRMIWSELPQAEARLARPLGALLRSQRRMLVASWPLMASLLLQSLFAGANVVLLQYFQGDAVVGWYDAARKWVMNMLNIVPSLFTFAIFPVISRQAVEDRGRLRRSYRLSAKLLIMIALPVAVVVTLLAAPMVRVLSGAAFLPHGAVALRILVWSIIFGWINSLTNYVLIALNRQRYVVLASGARVVFAVAANVLFVPAFNYLASTWIIISGELLLALLFYVDLRRQLGAVAWGRVVGRPALAGLAMGATAWGLSSFSPLIAIPACVLVYLLALILLRALTAEEWAMLAPLAPLPLRNVLPSRRSTPA